MFVLLAFLLGGGSRPDISSLPFLRAGAAIALAGSILCLGKRDLAAIKVPLLLLGSIALLALIQLVPLPPELWSALPDRGLIARIDGLVGTGAWRPITLSPSATLNALAALTVPLAGLLLFALVRDIDLVLIVFVCVGVLSASLGILQLFADPRSGIFLYEITNNGSAVGLFANRNHHAVFLACCVLMSLYLARNARSEIASWVPWAMGSASVYLGLAVVTNASRAGLIALLLVIMMSVTALVWERRTGPEPGVPKAKSKGNLLLQGGLAVAGALILGVFALAERSPALSRIMENDALEDMRARILSILLDMAADFQPWGAGLGAFEHAYRMREPIDLVGPSYVNEAHNDWLQFVIEGGALSVLIVASIIAFAIYRIAQMMRASRQKSTNEGGAWLGLGLMVVLGAASVVDYPLRAPSLMLLGIIALALFAKPALKVAKSGS